MPKKKHESTQPMNIKVGNISNITGEVNIAAGDITTYHTNTGLSAEVLEQLFDQVYRSIEQRPETSKVKKDDLKAEVQDIQSIVTQTSEKNEPANENILLRHFRNIARMAPDVLEVITAVLADPLSGLGIAVAKIAAKALENT
jgi:hypothetical protein